MGAALPWIGPLIILAGRLVWQRRPNLATCSLFWLIAFLFVVVLGWANAPSQYILTLGILSNALVTLANGGYMPVKAQRRLTGPARSLWVQRTSGQRLLFLADNFGNNTIRFSVGDALLLAGIILALAGF
jgi:hypothetical protein